MCAFAAALGCSGTTGDPCRLLDGGARLCGPTAVELPVLGGGNSPVLNATLDGKSVELLVDTGAQATVVSSSLLGVDDETWTPTSSLCFGDLCVQGERVFGWDTPFSSPDGPHGLVGMETLRHFVLELDRGQSVRLSHTEPACRGERRPITFSEPGTPLVDISIDGLVLSGITIDTGAEFTVLDDSTVARLDDYVTTQSVEADVCTIEGCTPGGARTSTVHELCVADICQSEVAVKYPVFDAVGNSFLARQRVAFDFPRSEIVFCD